jgi:hypothetical protein
VRITKKPLAVQGANNPAHRWREIKVKSEKGKVRREK